MQFPIFPNKKGNGIAVCKVAFLHEYAQLYFQMYKAVNDKIHSRKQVAMEQQYFVASRLDHATQSLIVLKRSNSTHEMSDVSVISSNDPNALGFASVGWSKSTNLFQSSQPSIIASMKNSVQSDIRGNNN